MADELRSVHRPVLVRETLKFLELTDGLTVVDGTVGGGGHSEQILKFISPNGLLIGIDRDPEMLARAANRLPDSNRRLVTSSYSKLRDVLDDLQIETVDRVLLDLGYSSDQLADDNRGFSFDSDGPLDLRFQPAEGISAAGYLATVDVDELERILRDYGEEPRSRAIAECIVDSRKQQPIETARDLADLVRSVVGKGGGKRHPATQVFQALRIAVNDELRELEIMLDDVLPACVASGGRVVVISFHSLEDRLVKSAFRKKDQWETLTRKPVTATATEARINPRSRTAKLRAATRIG